MPRGRPRAGFRRITRDTTLPQIRGTAEERAQVRIRWIADATLQVLPGADLGLIEACVRRVAVSPGLPGLLKLLCADVVREPSVLVTGTSYSYRVTHQFIEALLEAGVAGPARAHCQLCPSTVLTKCRHELGGLLCGGCLRTSSTAVCPGCGLMSPLVGHDQQRKRVCVACSRRDRLRTCVVCGRRNRRFDPAASDLCHTCAAVDQDSWRVCCDCGQRAPVHTEWASGPMCRRCHWQRERSCVQCGRWRRVKSRIHGEAVCSSCTTVPQTLCGTCLHPRSRVAGLSNLTCGRCGSGEIACCPTCGAEAFVYSPKGPLSTRCLACRTRAWLDEQFPAGSLEGRPTTLRPFIDRLASTDNPEQLRTLLRNGPAHDVLAGLASGAIPLTHEAIDEAVGGQPRHPTSVVFLRRLLVAAGTLPTRDEDLAALERALNHTAAALPPEESRLIRSYIRWHILPRARRRSQAAGSARAPQASAKASATVAASFLTSAHEARYPPSQIPQQLVDAWLADHPRQMVELGAFLRWAARRRLVPNLDLPAQPVPAPSRFQADQTHSNLLTRVMSDATQPVGDRLAGCLVLLYGQTARSIVTLRRHDVDVSAWDDQRVVRVRLGDDPVELTGVVAQLAHDLATAPSNHGWGGALSRSFTTDSEWLFPGRGPGKQLGAEALTKRLQRLGIRSREGRNTALLTLARQVPPSVLTDLLGVSDSTADRFRDLAAGAWTEYVTHRPEGRTLPTPASP